MEVVCEFWIYETDARARKIQRHRDTRRERQPGSDGKICPRRTAPSDASLCSDARQPFDLSPWQPLPTDFPKALDRAWHTAQDALATLAPNAKHKIATKSSHYIQVQEPQLVIDAIKRVVVAARNPSAWTTSR